MKALHFAKPSEYRLEITTDPLVQGGVLEGRLEMTNRGGAAQEARALEVALGFAVFKTLKSEGRTAMRILERQTLLQGQSVAPGATIRADFSFALGLNFPPHSKTCGPFVLYGGNVEDPEDCGQMDLPVVVSPPLASFIEIFENHHAFLAGETRHNGNLLEVRFKPPSSHPTLVELLVQLDIGEEETQLEFRMRGKSVQGGASGGVASRKKEHGERVPTRELLPPGGMPNRGLYREIWQRMVDALVPPRM